MIVTSKRCFINCVAQFMDRQTLKDANYYIIDVSNSNTRLVNFNKEVVFDPETGQQVIREIPVPNQHHQSISQYHIRYSPGAGGLDPRTNILSSTSGTTIGSDYTNNGIDEAKALKIYQDYLMEPDVIGAVYDWFHGDYNAPRGNGLMIAIICEEDNVRVFGHTICQYISNVIGDDVEFIDPQVRPLMVPGFPNYKGNKEMAEKILRDQRDSRLLKQLIENVSMMGYAETRSNFMTFLNMLGPAQLIHLYELAFPNDPLPPGNYTTDQLKRILIGKTSDKLSDLTVTSEYSNRFETYAYLDSITDELKRLG